MLRLLRTLLLACLLPGVVAAPTAQAQHARLQVRADMPAVQPGDTLLLTVRIAPVANPAPDLFGIGFQIHFDPAAFEVVDYQRGALIAGFPIGGFNGKASEVVRLVTPDEDLDGNGTADGKSYLAYAFTLLQGKASAVQPEGEVLLVPMRALDGAADGSYAIELQQVAANDQLGGAITLGLAHDAVRVSTTSRAQRHAFAPGDGQDVTFALLDGLRLAFLSLDAATELQAERSEATVGGTPMPADYLTVAPGSWHLAQDGATAFEAKVCIPFSLVSDEVLDRSKLRLLKREADDQPWEILTTTLEPGAATPEWVCAEVPGFSEFVVAAPASALPVELVRFDARQADGAAVRLAWATASETNNAGFEVQQRSAGGAAWKAIGFVEGRGTTVEAQAYQFRVDGLAPGRHAFRLKQVDYDGTFDYSPVVEVDLGVPGAYRLLPNHPNPFNPATSISFDVPVAGEVVLQVFDLLGHEVATLVDGRVEAGRHTATFDADTLPSGIYLYRLRAGSVVQTRSMVLVK